jgi:hypothetical protein
MRTKLPTPTTRAGVLIFASAQRRRSGARLRLLEQTYRDAVEQQARTASRLEDILSELERSSLRAQEAAWALSCAQQSRTSCLSFGEVMEWLAQVCRVRNPGEHFCIAETVRSAAVRERTA